jgi:hypothetical protein
VIWVRVGLLAASAVSAAAAMVYARRARDTAVRAAMASVRARQAADWAERAAAADRTWMGGPG